MSKPSRTSRRDFLKGKSAVVAIDDLAQGIQEDGAQDLPLAPPAADARLLRFSHRAMACEFEVLLNAAQYPDGAERALEALDLIDVLEDQMTVFRPTSEVSRLNAVAAAMPVAVEPRLFALFELAERLYLDTQRAFDITAGPLTKVWGFYRRQGRLPDAAELQAALAHVGMRHVALDREQQTVRFDTLGVEINLGSIGKGYALDRCGEQLIAADINDFLLHGGNSSVLARGSMLGSPRGGWDVGLPNPLRPQERLGEIHLCNRGLATSGSGTQFFVHEGRTYGHIIDPRTGQPAEGVLTATILAPTAAEADALSTAFYVLGPDAAAEFCRTHTGVGAILVCRQGRGGRVEIKTCGLAEGEFMLTGEAPCG
jgi:thiamine biosynthesis lipoprotein